MVEGVSRKLAREFREKIQTGQWAVGQKVPTTRQLAASYGVSLNTVQSAFRELEASDLIERRPRLGGYVKNRPMCSAIRSSATTIAVVGPLYDAVYNAIDNWGTRIIRGCERELAPQGFHMSMFSYQEDEPESLGRILAHFDRARDSVAGAMCILRPKYLELLEELDKRDIPWVMINRPSEHAGQNFVAHDAFAGARLVGACFAKMKMDRVVVLSVPIETGRSSGDKLFGCIRGYIECGGDLRNVDFVQCAGTDEPDGHKSFSEYVARFGKPRAVMAAGDLLALGAMRVCRENGWSIPGEVCVVGSTGLDAAKYAHPPLTNIEEPMEAMGENAGRMLLQMAREGVRRMMGRWVPGTLVQRESFKVPEAVMADVREAIGRVP